MSRIHVEDHFAEFGREFDQAMRRALVHAAAATREEAKRNAPKGDTGKLESSIHIGPLREDGRRYQIDVFAGMFYGRFLEFGTLGQRKRKLKQPERRRRAAAEGSGIEPRYFMLKAGRATADALVLAVENEMRKLR